jgi:hypothetical protein
MQDLSLFQFLFILGTVGGSAVLVINVLFDVYTRKAPWQGWGPLD